MESSSIAVARNGTEAEPEYDGSISDAPVELLAPLFALILAFGLFLSVLIPWGYSSQVVSELERGELLAVAWHAALAGLSFFVLLRWCTIQTMAFVAHCRQQGARREPDAPLPLVSILVPAYQESETI